MRWSASTRDETRGSYPSTKETFPCGGTFATGPNRYAVAGEVASVGAAVLDGLIVGIAFAIIYTIITTIALSSGSGTALLVTALIGLLAYLAIAAAYFTLTMGREGQNNGQTVGKQVLNIRVVQEDGRPMDPGKVLVREVLVRGLLFGGISVITLGFGSILSLVDVLWPLWDDHRRALHDMIAKTRVIQA